VTLRFERPYLLEKVKTGSAYASCVNSGNIIASQKMCT